jgi:hypothetical protein
MGNNVHFAMGKAEKFLQLHVASFFDENGNPFDVNQLITNDLATIVGNDDCLKGRIMPQTFGDIFDVTTFLGAMESRLELQELVCAAVIRAEEIAGVIISDDALYYMGDLMQLIHLFPAEQQRLFDPPGAGTAACLTAWRLEEFFVPFIDKLMLQVETGEMAALEEAGKVINDFSQYILDLHEFLTTSIQKGFKDFLVIFDSY